MKKVGIFGGTFDPVHDGHIKSIKYVLKYSFLDEILVIPCSYPSHKNAKSTTDIRYRLKKLNDVFKDERSIKVSDIESKIKGPNYTIDTLNYLKENNPNIKYYIIIGEDNLLTIHTWKDYKNLIENSDFILMKRGGYNVSFSDCSNLSKEEFDKLRMNEVDNPKIEMSSTQIKKSMLA